LDVVQVFGTYSAQNQLGLISHFIVFPFLALLLTGPRGWIPPVVILSGFVIEALTLSRAALGIGGFGFATVLMISAVRQWTSRKMLVLFIGLGMTAISAPLLLSSFAQREMVANKLAASDSSREAFERAAVMILSDYPMGIGSNQYLTI